MNYSRDSPTLADVKQLHPARLLNKEVSATGTARVTGSYINYVIVTSGLGRPLV